MTYGFLLHSRPFRENSAIATLFLAEQGRIDAVVNGARNSKKGQQRLPVLFSLYDLEWTGRSTLKKLIRSELVGTPCLLSGMSLYCGLYLNELLYRLLVHDEAQPVLFEAYAKALSGLVAGETVEPLLRNFELTLLEAQGHGLLLDRDGEHWLPLVDGQSYVYWREAGLLPYTGEMPEGGVVASASVFQAIARRDFTSPETCRIAKQLVRHVLAMYLGGQPLRSRELFSR